MNVLGGVQYCTKVCHSTTSARMGCGVSKETIEHAKVKGAAMYAEVKEKAVDAVAHGKYAAVGCKFDPDAAVRGDGK